MKQIFLALVAVFAIFSLTNCSKDEVINNNIIVIGSGMDTIVVDTVMKEMTINLVNSNMVLSTRSLETSAVEKYPNIYDVKFLYEQGGYIVDQSESYYFNEANSQIVNLEIPASIEKIWAFCNGDCLPDNMIWGVPGMTVSQMQSILFDAELQYHPINGIAVYGVTSLPSVLPDDIYISLSPVVARLEMGKITMDLTNVPAYIDEIVLESITINHYYNNVGLDRSVYDNFIFYDESNLLSDGRLPIQLSNYYDQVDLGFNLAGMSGALTFNDGVQVYGYQILPAAYSGSVENQVPHILLQFKVVENGIESIKFLTIKGYLDESGNPMWELYPGYVYKFDVLFGWENLTTKPYVPDNTTRVIISTNPWEQMQVDGVEF